MADIGDWVRDKGISEVECLVPDMNGVLRGKVFPAAKLVQFSRNNALRLPSSIFSLTITGQYADVPSATRLGAPGARNPGFVSGTGGPTFGAFASSIDNLTISSFNNLISSSFSWKSS